LTQCCREVEMEKRGEKEGELEGEEGLGYVLSFVIH